MKQIALTRLVCLTKAYGLWLLSAFYFLLAISAQFTLEALQFTTANFNENLIDFGCFPSCAHNASAPNFEHTNIHQAILQKPIQH